MRIIWYLIGMLMAISIMLPLVGMDQICPDHHGGIWLFEPAKCKGTP